VDEVAGHGRVVDGRARGVETNDVRARLDEEPPRAARDAKRRITIDRCMIDEVALVLDALSREKLPRVRARRSAVAVVENDAPHGDAMIPP